MNNVFVRPRLIDGQPASLPDPQTGAPLAAAGEWKPRTAFWIRRIAQCDVIEGAPEVAAAAPAAPMPQPDPAPAIEDRAPRPSPNAKPPVEARAPRPAKA